MTKVLKYFFILLIGCAVGFSSPTVLAKGSHHHHYRHHHHRHHHHHGKRWGKRPIVRVVKTVRRTTVLRR